MEPATILTAAALGAVYGVVFAVYGVITKKEPDEPIDPKKAGRTVVLWGAAGIVVSLRQGAVLTEGNIAQTTTEVAVVGVAFDMAWAGLRRRGYLDWIPGVNS